MGSTTGWSSVKVTRYQISFVRVPAVKAIGSRLTPSVAKGAMLTGMFWIAHSVPHPSEGSAQSPSPFQSNQALT